MLIATSKRLKFCITESRFAFSQNCLDALSPKNVINQKNHHLPTTLDSLFFFCSQSFGLLLAHQTSFIAWYGFHRLKIGIKKNPTDHPGEILNPTAPITRTFTFTLQTQIRNKIETLRETNNSTTTVTISLISEALASSVVIISCVRSWYCMNEKSNANTSIKAHKPNNFFIHAPTQGGNFFKLKRLFHKDWEVGG